jgi:NAD+ synthase (glutamine-hydrolysing)
MQSREQESYKRIHAPLSLSGGAEDVDFTLAPTRPVEPSYHIAEEEIALGPACYLFDFLRRSGVAGYFLPLSGGIDSCATSVIVHSMCRLVHEAIKNGDQQVREDLLRITGQDKDSQWRPKNPQEIAGKLFCSAYMGMEGHSSQETRKRAKDLAAEIGSLHFDFDINPVVAALLALFKVVTGIVPKFKQHGGTNAESLAIQNIQARIRMVISYMFAQLVPGIFFKRERPGSLLVLGSA